MADQWKPENDDTVRDVTDKDVRGKATDEEDDDFEDAEDLDDEDDDEEEGTAL
jgi:hypothetical protein